MQVPPRLLVNGRYFQWQLPHVLADGSLVAARLTGDGAALLRLRGGRLDELPLSTMFSPAYDDGTGELRPTTGYLTPGGTPFSVDVDFDHGTVRIEQGQTVQRLVLRTVAGAVAHTGVQVRAGPDDSLYLFLIGISDDGESGQLVGYLPLDPGGGVGEVEPFLNPDSLANPGSPAQLVVAPGSSAPMLVYIRPDGVHVYARR